MKLGMSNLLGASSDESDAPRAHHIGDPLGDPLGDPSRTTVPAGATMCYMSANAAAGNVDGGGLAVVGVRELRQNLSVYLRRVAAGEAFEVTERGRAVAVLAPIPDQGDAFDKLVAAGLARPAQGDLLDLGPPKRALRTTGISISEALREQRADRL